MAFTERLGLATRWGRYLTRLERQGIDEALRNVGTPGDALEVGCQGGRWLEILAEKGWRVIGTDVDEPALRASQSRVPSSKCILVRPEDRTIPCSDGSVSLLLCIEAFPVIHSDWFAAEAERVLGPGGALMSVFMNRRSLRGLFVLLRERLGLGPRNYHPELSYALAYAPWKRQMQRRAFGFIFERGACWFPFSRHSNSFLIPPCTALERAVGLQRLVGLSPWVVFVARKAEVV
jgi:SAM-dependent methyltransferase